MERKHLQNITFYSLLLFVPVALAHFPTFSRDFPDVAHISAFELFEDQLTDLPTETNRDLGQSDDESRKTSALSATITPRARKLGDPFSLSCAVNPSVMPTSISSCWFKSPDGKTYVVDIDKGEVIDKDTGREIFHMTTTSNKTMCNLNILIMTKCHQASWLCHVETNNTDTFQEAFISAYSSPSEVDNFRLPGNVEPSSYNLKLIFDISKKMVVGQVDINLNVTQNTSKVVVHSKRNTIYEDYIEAWDCVTNMQIPIKGFGYDAVRNFFIITFDQEVFQGDSIMLSMQFSNPISERYPTGVHLNKINSPGKNKTEYMVATQFEPVGARTAFPCLDEPQLKAVFNTWIGRLPSQLSLSNMPKKRVSIPVNGSAAYDNYVWDQYEPTLRMSTYLNAFIVSGDYQPVECKGNSLHDCNLWTTQAQTAEMEYAANVSNPLMTYFENMFQQPFPLPKVDHAAVSNKALGAMENYGLIIYGDDILLTEPGEATTEMKETTAYIIAHELAHQWFGNLVTMEWWSDLWLNEGFAQYYHTVGLDYIEPESQYMDRMIHILQVVMDFDASHSTNAVSNPADKLDGPGSSFNRMTYQKGQVVIRMLVNWLGEDVFLQGIRSYLANNKFGSVTHDDLWNELDLAARKNGVLGNGDPTVKQITDPWILQKGYPVVHVERDYAKGEVRLGQKQFLRLAEKQESTSQWHIPITYAIPGDDFSQTAPAFWFSPGGNNTFRVEDCEDEPLIFNVQQMGIYRVNYDAQNWKLLIKALHSHHEDIHRSNRAQLLHDAVGLGQNGQLNITTALELSLYIRKEDEYIPIKTSLNVFRFMYDLIRQDDGLGDFRRYFNRQFSHVYDAVCPKPFDEWTYTDRLLLMDIVKLLCIVGHYGPCQERAGQLFQGWMDQDDPDANIPIDPDAREMVYCTALLNGGEREWDFLFERFLNKENDNARWLMAERLGCTAEPWIMNRLLDRILDPSYDWGHQDALLAIRTATVISPVGPALTWRWMQAEGASILKRFGFYSMAMFQTITERFSTPLEIKQLEAFRDSNVLGGASQEVNGFIANAKRNMMKRDMHYETVVDWLRDNWDREIS